MVDAQRMVGRASAAEVLAEAWARTTDGLRVVVVRGDAGMGKTTLVDDLRDGVGGAALILTAAAVATASEWLPFDLWRRALSPLLHVDEVRQRLAPRDLAILTDFVLGSATDDVDVPAGWARERLCHVIASTVREAGQAGRPVLLVLEDLHWSDQSSLDLLRYLIARAAEQPLLIVLTTRDVPPESPLAATLHDLRRNPRTQWVELGGVDPDTLAAIIETHLGPGTDPALIEWYHSLSQGNPYFAIELARSGSRPPVMSGTVRDLVLAGLTQLPSAARAIVEALAVVGRPASGDLIEAVGSLGPHELDTGTHELRLRLLVVTDADSGDIGLRHDILRRAVYEGLADHTRRRLHGRAATAYAAEVPRAAWSAARASTIAEHWVAARAWPEAYRACVEAAELCLQALAFPEADKLLRRALELDRYVEVPADRRCALLEQGARVSQLVGDLDVAVERARAALEVAPPQDPLRLAHLYERLGRYLYEAGRGQEAEQAYDGGIAALDGSATSAIGAQLCAARASLTSLHGHYQQAIDLAEEAARLAREVSARAPEAYALVTLGCCHALLGSVDEGVRLLERSRAISADLGDVEGQLRADAALAFVLHIDCSLPAALDVCERGLALARGHGVVDSAGSVLRVNAVDVMVDLGQWAEADALAGEAGETVGRAASVLLLARGQIATAQGRLDDAERLLTQALTDAAGLDEPHIYVPIWAALAELALWRGKPDEAYDDVSRALDRLGHTDESALSARIYCLLSRARADLGLPQTALPTHPDSGSIGAAVRSAYLSAALAEATRGRPGQPKAGHGRGPMTLEPTPARLWRDVGDSWARLARPYDEAYSRWREAEAWLQERRRPRATLAAGRAAKLAESLGAAPLADVVAALAARSRLNLADVPAPEPRRVATGAEAFGLTAREVEVLRLIATGCTNRQLARTLHITEGTASVHVSRILTKMAVGSRTAAAAEAHRAGIVEVNTVT